MKSQNWSHQVVLLGCEIGCLKIPWNGAENDHWADNAKCIACFIEKSLPCCKTSYLTIYIYYIILHYILRYIYICIYYITLRHITLHYIRLYYIISCHIILYHIILYHIILYHIIYHIILYYTILYYIILYHIILYYSILYSIILYYIILYHWTTTTMQISPLLALTVWPVGTRHCQKALIWSWRTRWSVHLGSRTHQWLTGAFGGIQCIYIHIYEHLCPVLNMINHDKPWLTVCLAYHRINPFEIGGLLLGLPHSSPLRFDKFPENTGMDLVKGNYNCIYTVLIICFFFVCTRMF